jgi:hypothetical protein
MAIVRKSSLPDNSGPIPQTVYTLVIKSAEHKKSANNSDMLVLTLQIVSPANVPQEGKNVKTAGRTAVHRIVATDKSNLWVKEIEQLLGTELPEDIDTEEVCKSAAAALNPSDENPIQYLINVELKPVERYKFDPATKKDVIGEDGQKIVTGYTFERVSRVWPQACTAEVAGL